MEKKIRTITITQFDYIIRGVNDEELDIHGHAHQHSEFDVAGNLLKEIRYNRLGEFEEMLQYAYDDKGRLIREAYFPDEQEMAEEKNYERDGNGKLNRILKKYQDGSVDTTTFEYDANDRLVEKKTVNDEGETEEVEQFEWDQENLVGHKVLDESGNEVESVEEVQPDPDRMKTTRNEKGQVILEEEFDEDGELIMSVKRVYNENDLADEVEVFIDGRGRSISRHYFLRYEYTFFG